MTVTGAATALLIVSRGSPISRWHVRGMRIQPQVWLSILSTIMDALIIFALAEGATIAFWKHATRGTTVSWEDSIAALAVY